jgi:hypothetical protein
MSELEDASVHLRSGWRCRLTSHSVATHHQLWDSLFPTIPLASLMETVASSGMEAAVQLAHAHLHSPNEVSGGQIEE